MKTKTIPPNNWLEIVIYDIENPVFTASDYDLCPFCTSIFNSLEKDMLPDTDDQEWAIMAMYDNRLHCGGHECITNKKEKKHEYWVCFHRIDFDNGRFTEEMWNTTLFMTSLEHAAFMSVIKRLCQWSRKHRQWVYYRHSFEVYIKVYEVIG